MANPRVKVLAATFAMLTLASIWLIANEENVSANAWALLALAGVFAAAAVMAFFQNDEGLRNIGNDSIVSLQDQATEAQALPDPAEEGFDVPVI
jgi:hypothetical protein